MEKSSACAQLLVGGYLLLAGEKFREHPRKDAATAKHTAPERGRRPVRHSKSRSRGKGRKAREGMEGALGERGNGRRLQEGEIGGAKEETGP
eukprot:6175003-Pleurochrysis_carterae.AAC.2